jgi:glycerol-3-phosphate acyltransferase PlsX
MASGFAERVLEKPKPRVGLLNVGSEEGKGTDLEKETAALFSNSQVNFIGNIEGNDIFNGRADVIVCDGFVGNVVLKTAEGLYEVLSDRLKGLFSALEGAPGTGGVSDAVRTFRRNMDYAEQGGAPLLGINGIVMISHGRSDARAIRNALLGAAGVHRRGVLAAMIQGLATGNSRSHS